jgi:hypothetical protein
MNKNFIKVDLTQMLYFLTQKEEDDRKEREKEKIAREQKEKTNRKQLMEMIAERKSQTQQQLFTINLMHTTNLQLMRESRKIKH